MAVVLEVSRKIDLADKDAHSILRRAMQMGFVVTTASGRGAVAVPFRTEGATMQRVARANRPRKKTRGIYRIDEAMGRKMEDMRRDGLTIRAIARAFRLSTSGVGNYLKRRGCEAVAS